MQSDITVDRGLARRAQRIHGVNPVLLIEKITRERVLDSVYWQQECVPLNQLTILDQVVENVKVVGAYVSGGSGGGRPTRFISVVLRLLQLQPSREVIEYLLAQPDFKYLTAVAALYVRLTRGSADVYRLLEPLLEDSRLLRFVDGAGARLVHMDEYIDALLNEAKFCGLVLPRLVPREQLEDSEELEPRVSKLQDDFDEMVEAEEEAEAEEEEEEEEEDAEEKEEEEAEKSL